MRNGKVTSSQGLLWRVCRWILLILGVTLFLTGLSLIFLFPLVVERQIKKDANLRRDGNRYEKWLNPPYKASTAVYVYSVKNPDEVLNGSTPEVSTIGPYMYNQKMGHDVLEHTNNSIKYAAFDIYTFNATASCAECDLKHKVWIPNIVFQKFVEAASNPSMKAAQTALATQTPFLEVTVDDMLFNGYKDPFLDKVCEIPFMNFICDSVLDLPDKIAFLGNTNNTKNNVLQVSTGEQDQGLSLGQIETWNDQRFVPDDWWADEFSTMINGTDGGLYKPYIKKDDKLYIFVPDLCRSIYFIFERELQYRGVPAYRFIVPSELFDYKKAENEAFCFNSGKDFFTKNEQCLPNGLLDISRCRQGEAPIVVSLPNFLFAEEKVKRSVIGLNDSSIDHDSIAITIEPRTGVLLLVERRYQINIAMWKGIDISVGPDLSRMHSGIVPVMSLFSVVEIDDETLSMLYSQLLNVEKMVSALCVACIVIGTLLTGLVLVLTCCKSQYILSLLGHEPPHHSSVAPRHTEPPFMMTNINTQVH